MSARTQTRRWSREDVLSLGVRTDGLTACEIVYGFSRTKAYEVLAAGDVDFPVIARRGPNGGRTRYIVPTKAILDLLGLEGDPEAA